MILEILWGPIFTPLVIKLGGVKMGCVQFLPQVCPAFTPTCVAKKHDIFKNNFLISESH